MDKIKVITVFGTRPEAIKMAPLVLELKKRSEIESIVVVTAQHRQMLDQVLDIFGITPDFDLNIMGRQQTLTDITTRALSGLGKVFAEVNPDIVLVHGDTTTTFSGALAAFYGKIPVGHVEAGLRTYDIYSPFPEEMNRRLVGQIATLNFAPTKTNAENLRRENIRENIYITGNTVIDAVHKTVKENYKFAVPELAKIDFKREKVILMTAHRRENYGEPMENIMRAAARIANDFEDVRIVYPVHLSPAVREAAERNLKGKDRVTLIDPIDVDDMHNLMARAFFVMTDSGGLQEEAPALGKPVLVLRRETERPEAVKAGTVKISGVSEKDIYKDAAKLLRSQKEYEKMAHAVNPYGDGQASRRIADAILYHFGRIDKKPDEFTAG